MTLNFHLQCYNSYIKIYKGKKFLAMIFFFFHSYLPPYSLRETLCDYMSTDLTFSPRKWQAAEGTGLVYERMAIIGVSAVCLVMSDSM